MTKYVKQFGEYYYYYRRVPSEVKEYDERRFVKISLKTKDEREAHRLASHYNDFIEEEWRAKVLSGEKVDGEARYKAAIGITKLKGKTYKPLPEILQGTDKDLIERLKIARKDVGSELARKAIMGAVPVPEIKLSNVAAKYWPLTLDRLHNKTDHQKRRWKNPRNKAMEEFIEVVDDKPLAEINRGDVLSFWEHLRDLMEEGKKPDTLNKKMRFVKDMVRVVSKHSEIKLPITEMFEELKFQDWYEPRPPFDPEYVEKTLLRSLDEMNADARFIVYVMADTGARVSEICGLDKNDIVLDAEIPYIDIVQKEGQNLKTRHSVRRIPLVGAALLACQAMPEGVKYEIPDYASATINKFFRTKKLKPTPEHKLYSLRHTFKDRLRNVEAPLEIIDYLMGHDPDQIKYGLGYKFEIKQKYMQEIAYQPERF